MTSVKRVKAGKYTLRVTATDAQGLSSGPADQTLKLVG